MKKRITSLLVLIIVLVGCKISLGQTSYEKDYAAIKSAYISQYNEYIKNISFTNLPPPVDPLANYIEDSEGRLIPSLNNQVNNPPFIAPLPNSGIRDVVSSSYSFSQSIQTYVPLVGGTVVASGASIDDNTYTGQPIGFTFHFNGNSYTTLGIDANGYIWFGTATPTSSDRSAISMTVAVDGTVSPTSYDLVSLASGEIRLQTQGVSPNRYCTVQFKNWASYNVTTDTMNFQVILYETSDSVSIMYGYWNKDATTRSAQVGMRGATNADFVNRTTATSWSATTAGTLNTDVCALSPTIYPSNGLTFTYRLPTPGNMTYMSSNTVQVTPGAPVVANTFNNPIIQVQVVDTGSLTPFSITSLRLETTGSTNPSVDILNAKVYYTGSVNSFNTTNQFGATVANPNGVFNVSGSQVLAPNATNYFWVTYDIRPGAVLGNLVDAQCDSIIGTGTMGGRVPTTVAPAGSRPIGSPLCGIYNIPGDFPNITAAIAAVNSIPITCAVTFNVAAGFTETAANLVLNAGGTSSAPITFRKNGSGANPLITAAPGAGLYDGVIILNGVNYVTFDGIDVQENAANVTTTTQMEWGYALLRADGTHGNQNNTIKNCNITLNKTNVTTYGIYSGLINTAGVSQIPTSIAGTNSNNSFLSNNISNSFNGIYLYSYVDASTPFSLEDQNNVVSTTGSGRSSITNFGSSTTTATAYGIYAYYQRNPVYSNTMINSNGGTVHGGTLYGIYNYSYYNNANVLITGDTVTLATSYAFAYIYGIYNYTYYGFDNIITNNVVTGCQNPTTSSYYSYYIYNYFAAGSIAYQNSLTMTGNKVIGNTYGTATAIGGTYDIYCYDYCMSFVNISNNLDSGNTVLGTTAYLNYGIYSPGTTYNSKINNNRVVNNTICGTTAASTSYGIYNTSGTFSAQIDSNVVANNTLPTTSTHSMYFMYNTSAAPSLDYSYNTVSGNTSSGAGTFYSMYYSATPGFGSVENITNNTISNQSKTTATGTGSIYGIYKTGSGTGTINLNNNTITGFTSAAATTLAGIYQIGSPPNYLNISNNKVGNFTTIGASTIYGIYNNPAAATQPVVSQDSVYNLVSGGGSVYGLYMVNGNPVSILKNRISGLSSNTLTSGTVYGIFISSGVINNIYDNIVSDLTAPASTNSPAISGIYLSGGTYDNLYYNTVLLKATSTSVTTFGTAALYASTTPTVDLRNNVLIDSSSPGPSSNSVAYRRSSSTLTTYQTTSNNNCLYAGIPSATHLLYYDVTNSVQTLAAYKSLMISRDNNSVTEYPPFVNSVTAPFDLRIKTTIGTQLESGAQIISTSGNPVAPLNITQDAFNVARYPNAGYPVGGFTPTAPDMGANEFGGLIADVNGPLVVYTPLGIGGTSNRPFTNVAITDASGVNTTAGTKPRCYYRRSTDGNVINDNTSGTDGWKYVEATGTTNPFDFTIDYSKLNGGTGVVAGQSVLYFVVAQDLVGTPNVGWNQATFTTGPTTVALVTGNAPITNTLSYTIGTATFSGAYNVGTAQTYTSLTGAGGMFAALNAGTITGNVTLNITSDLTEDGTYALNAANETGVGGYKITIVPASASVKTISGTVANGMIRFNGARRVTVDGNNGFGGKYLTFRNINGLNPTITFMNEAGRDTIKNCTIESNNATVTSGTVLFSTTTLGTGMGNDSICINSCDIRDRSDATGYPANGICSNGSTTTLQTYNSYNSIINCNIYNQFLDVASFQAGINLYTASTSWVINNNSVYQTAPKVVTTAATYIGIFVNNSLCNDISVTNNYVGGSAPLCAGSPLTLSGAGLYNYYGIYLFVGGLVPSSIQGNVITNYNLTTNPASGSSVLFRGINVPTTAAWCNIGNLSGNTVGSGTGTGAITLTVNTTTTGYTTIGILSNGIGNINNNTVGSITVGGNAVATTAFSLQGIQWSSTIPGWTYNCSNNLIGSLTTPNSMQITDSLSPGGLRGFVFGNGAGTTNNLTNNVVANLTAYVQATTSNTVASATYGFSTSAAGNYNITNNTIYNLTVNSNALTPTTFLVSGIPHSSTGVNNISQNTMYGLVLNMTSTGAGTNAGMFVGGSQGTVVSRNKMYDLRYSAASSVSSSPNLGGIWVANATGPMTISNNMVSITNGDASEYAFIKSQQQPKQHINIPFTDNQIPTGKLIQDNKEYRATDGNSDEDLVVPVVYSAEKFESTVPTSKKEDQSKKSVGKDNVNSVNAAFVAGIITQAGGTQQNASSYYYNSVYVGGTQPGASTYGSYAFAKQFNTDLVLRNNLFVNARTGGTGNHYCIANETSPIYEGWPVTASNYNVLLGSNAATIGEWGAGVPQTLAQWITSSGGDKQTWSTTTATVSPTSLFTNVAVADLSIQTGNAAAWLVSGKGIAISSVNNDFAGNTRVTAITSGCTDIGAFEFAATPPSNPVATVDNAPGSGVISTYSLYGRKICAITWGAGGVYPATMNVNYYSGVNPLAPNVTTPNRSSNSYWTVVPGSGTFSGTTYNFTLYYGDNETYTVTNPNTNILLAKNDLGYWMSYPAGSSTQQSNLNWAGLSVTTTGLPNFSSFTLTDAAFPALSLVSPAYGSINQPQALTCVWRKFAGATSYRFQLSTDSLFNTLIYNDAALTDSTRAVSGLLMNTRYWWRVNAVNGVGTGAWSQVFKFNTVSIIPPAVVNLTVIPGGFYSAGTGTLNMKDTIRVYLVDSVTCVKVDSTKILLDSVTFSASPNFSIANTGNYYIFVTHRNHIVISSRLIQTVTRGATVSYNFVSDSSNSYGNNVIKVSTSPVRWAMIPGDANQDQFVDGLDQSAWILQNGLDGYLPTDFNGDVFIDGLDQSIWILFNGNSSFLPCAFPDYYTNPNSKKHVVIDNRNTKQIFNNNSNQDTRKGNK